MYFFCTYMTHDLKRLPLCATGQNLGVFASPQLTAPNIYVISQTLPLLRSPTFDRMRWTMTLEQIDQRGQIMSYLAHI